MNSLHQGLVRIVSFFNGSHEFVALICSGSLPKRKNRETCWPLVTAGNRKDSLVDRFCVREL